MFADYSVGGWSLVVDSPPAACLFECWLSVVGRCWAVAGCGLLLVPRFANWVGAICILLWYVIIMIVCCPLFAVCCLLCVVICVMLF